MAEHENECHMTDPTGWYKGSPLSCTRSIRLIKLDIRPDEVDDKTDISCKIGRLCFDDYGCDSGGGDLCSFIAISYTWGDPMGNRHRSTAQGESKIQPKEKMIYCNNIALPITSNLFCLLSRLRQTRCDCWIWADAICVNQDDDKERSAQVQLMADIYAKASAVLVWLGEHDNYSNDAFGKIIAMSKASKQNNLQVKNGTRLLTNSLSEASVTLMLGIPPAQDKFFESIAALLTRAWFSRVWTLQEAVLAHHPQVMCGESVLDMTYFLDAISLKYLKSAEGMALLSESYAGGSREETNGTYPQSLATLATGLIEIAALREILASSNHSWKSSAQALYQMLLSYKRRDATDVRDFVYAYLPISSKFQQPEETDFLIPDYEKSATEVFIEATNYIIKSLQHLNILALCCSTRLKGNSVQSEPGRLAGLPSWTPSYNISSFRPLMPEMFTAMGNIKHLLQAHSNSSILEVVGIRISGTFLLAGLPSMHDQYDIKRSFMPFLIAMHGLVAQKGSEENNMRMTLDILLRHQCPWPRGGKETLEDETIKEAMLYLQELLARMTCLELWERNWPNRETMEHPEMIKALVSEANADPVMARTLFPSYKTINQYHNPLADFWSKEKSNEKRKDLQYALAQGILTTRYFFHVKSTPFFGAIYHRYRPGDQLWFLQGLNIPVFLRPHHGDCFELVGAAYIYNYMLGKILETDWAKCEKRILLV